MLSRLSGIGVALLVVLSGCGGDDAPPGSDGGPGGDAPGNDGGALADGGSTGDGGAMRCEFVGLAPGDTELEIDFDGMMRTFFVHVPPSYVGDAMPVVFDFHGFTSTADQQKFLSGMTVKADEEGFITVHGEGVGFLQSWNGGDCCGDAATNDLDDVGLARAVIEDLATRVCIDRSRIYSTGMSNGGFLTHRIACEAADVFAAVAPVAGVMGIPDSACTPARPISVMHFHGTSDAIVPYAGGGLESFRSVDDTIAGWVERNGCTGDPMNTFDMGNSSCETWNNCDGGVEVTLCTVEGFPHWWPGNDTGGSADIDATDHMWEMFARNHL